jgi:cell division protein ZapA
LAQAQQSATQQNTKPQTAARESTAVVVEIYDQIYQLSGTDAAYIERLAALVDSKMRAVSAHGATVDSLRVAVLAALNIADELIATQARHDKLATAMGSASSTLSASVQSRADSLMGMLDEVLETRKAG